MSNIYIQEPQTVGKVLLGTTVGDIDIELFSKEAPKACRNFVQLCMEGYYDGTIFHRVVPNFIAQGGDPTGTGHGGESIYGQPFKDEFHTRLRFVRRGLIAMANSGPNDNGSQFFFTMGPTPELMNKHTIFGKVSGNTVYNMIKLQDCEIDANERPLFPHKILKTEVLSNPFDDIVPRVIKQKKEEDVEKKPKSKSKATKNFKLLSFGEEAEEDEEMNTKVSEGWKGKSKSSHDLANDPKLSAVPALETLEENLELPEKRELETQESADEEEKEAARENVRKKLKKEPEEKSPKKIAVKTEPEESKAVNRKEELKQEVKQLKKEIKESKKRTEEMKVKQEDKGTIDQTEPPSTGDPLADFKKERQKYKALRKQQGTKGLNREEITLAILDKFKTKLQSARSLAADYDDEEEEKVPDDQEEEEEDVNDQSWMSHKLHFEDNTKKVLDANIHDVDRYEIYDPRNPITKRRREASKQSMKNRR